MRRRFGIRGTILLLVGAAWILHGVSVATSPPPPGYPILAHLPALQAATWIIAGLVAIVCAPRRQGYDTPGWVALYFPAGMQWLAYFYTWADTFIDFPLMRGDGNWRGIIGVTSYATIAYLIYVLSGIRESETPA